ncbi:MAG: DNRLRE domain-containing protein [Planctomycetota bacterium]|nr:DNRLRE domain-containing protein [Planctomycetota bacterium]
MFRLFPFSAAFLAAVCLAVSTAGAIEVQLTLTDADSIKPFQDHNYNSKSYIYSWERNIAFNMHVAYMKFDLTAIPDGSTIDSMSLRMSTYLNPFTGPQVTNVYRTNNDNWSSTTTDLYPGIDELLAPDLATPSQFTFYTWALDVNAFDPQVDLTDNVLSLGLTSPANIDWFAIDGLNFSRYPVLTINYTEASEPLMGDLNSDGFVGQDDLNLILSNWGQSVPPGDPLADPDGSGFVGQDDLNEVLGGWGQGDPLVEAVPEPTTLLLLGLAGVGLVTSHVRLTRRRQQQTD